MAEEAFQQRFLQAQGMIDKSSDGTFIGLYDYPAEDRYLPGINTISLLDMLPPSIQQDGILVEIEVNVNVRQIKKRTRPDFVKIHAG